MASRPCGTPDADGERRGTEDLGTLRVAWEPREQAMVVRVAGEVDMLTANGFEAVVTKAIGLASSPGTVVVDLTEVEFFGSSGLAVLVAAHKRCEQRGLSLSVVVTGAAVRRSLEATGLDRQFAVYPTVSAALSDATP